MKNTHNMAKYSALISIILLSGCATIHNTSSDLYPANNETPIAINHKSNLQRKLQAAEHWKQAAQDAANSLINSLKEGGSCITKTGCAVLHVKRSCESTGCSPKSCETTFSKVFHNEFITALVNSGYQVSTIAGANMITVEVDAQVVKFSENRPQYRYAGTAREVGEGIWAIRDVGYVSDGDGGFIKPHVGNAYNWFRTEFASGQTPSNELIVTASAISPNQAYIARNTSIYYTADSDIDQYSCKEVVPVQIVIPVVKAETKTWNVPIVGDCSTPRCTNCATPRCTASDESKR